MELVLPGRGERVMLADESPPHIIPLKEREIDHPEALPLAFADQFEIARNRAAKLAKHFERDVVRVGGNEHDVAGLKLQTLLQLIRNRRHELCDACFKSV